MQIELTYPVALNIIRQLTNVDNPMTAEDGKLLLRYDELRINYLPDKSLELAFFWHDLPMGEMQIDQKFKAGDTVRVKNLHGQIPFDLR